LWLSGAGLTAALVPGCADEPAPTTVNHGDSNSDDDSDTTDTSDEEDVKDAGKTPTGKVDAGKADAGKVVPKSDAGKVVEDAGAPAITEPTTDGGTVSKPDGAVASTTDGGGDKPVVDSALCHLKPYQVGIMGDSYINLSGDITKFLQEDARKAGALGASEKYIDKSKSGAAMQKGNLLAPAIPTQLPAVLSDSKSAGPEGVKLVVMTGGGNDVLIDASQCKTLTMVTEECKTVVSKTLEVQKKLFVDMKTAGIQHVIYFWYPDLGPSGGKVINDYSIPIAKAQCEADPSVKCHFVDTRDGWRGHPEFIGPDGIHPTAAGSKVISDLVWQVMVDNCLGSK
jgi:lysophospholipase L1-like esterase